MDDVRRWSPPGWTGQPVLDKVECSATAIDEALLSINSWLRGASIKKQEGLAFAKQDVLTKSDVQILNRLFIFWA